MTKLAKRVLTVFLVFAMVMALMPQFKSGTVYAGDSLPGGTYMASEWPTSAENVQLIGHTTIIMDRDLHLGTLDVGSGTLTIQGKGTLTLDGYRTLIKAGELDVNGATIKAYQNDTNMYEEIIFSIDRKIRFNNADLTIVDKGYADALATDGPLEIVNSKVDITGNRMGMAAGGSITINNSNVKIRSRGAAIQARSALNITKSTVDIKSTENEGIQSTRSNGLGVMVDKSTLRIEAGYRGINANGVWMINSKVQIAAGGAGIDVREDDYYGSIVVRVSDITVSGNPAMVARGKKEGFDSDSIVVTPQKYKIGTYNPYKCAVLNSDGSLAKKVVIKAWSIEDTSCADIPNQKYTGKAIEPALTVKHGTKTLKKGTDYTVSFKNNVNAGTATITIKGAGFFTSTQIVKFEINPVSIANASISGISNKTYTGKAITQTPTVKVGNTTLKSGTDYTVSYKNNVNAGTATVTIKGKGNYSGSVSKNFTIKANNYKASWNRLWGEKALDTMAAITKEYGKSNVAIVARFDKWEDALTAASLAGKYNAPVLMTASNKLSKQTKSELKRMGVKTVYVLGSKSDVTDGVVSQIKATGVKTVERIDGKTPSARAIAVSNKIGKLDRSNTVIIATHSGFYDALSVSPFAYASKSPIIYTESNKKLSDASIKHIKGGGFKYALIVGGPAVIPKTVETQLNNAGIKSGNITRLAGEKAYQTSLIIAEWATGKLKNGTNKNTGKLYTYASIKFQPTVKMAPTYVGVATGKSYYDALAGAALCGKHKGVLLLADDTNSSNTSFTKANKGKILQGYVFGGTVAISKKVYDACVKSTK